MRFFDSKNTSWKDALGVAAVLFISLLARAVLIFRGGQFYFSDEGRYQISRDVAELLQQGHLHAAFAQFTASPEHLGFKLVGILPALMEHGFGASNILPALFFSLFSVLNLYLIYKLSQLTGTASNEALLVLCFAAVSHSLLYHARHLVPYDMAMSLGLLALYIGLGGSTTAKTSIACGALSFFCFVTYNGYWIFSALAVLAHLFRKRELNGRPVQRTLWTGLGGAIPLALVFVLFQAAGINLFSEYGKFARTINQGSFAEGWSLPFEYFWHSEHFIIVILGIFSTWTIINVFTGKSKRMGMWAAGLIFVYLCLLIPSVFLHSFVVYGRLARQMMPFILILAVAGFMQLKYSKPALSWLVLIVIVAQGTWNFVASYNLMYPREFVAQVQTQFQDFDFSAKRHAFRAPLICQNHGYAIENVKYFLTPPDEIPQIDGELLRSESHPVNFLPYQYEGYTVDQRRGFRNQELQMSFYKIDDEFLRENSSIKNCIADE